MGLQKTITNESGVASEYHNIFSLNDIKGKSIDIMIASYLDKTQYENGKKPIEINRYNITKTHAKNNDDNYILNSDFIVSYGDAYDEYFSVSAQINGINIYKQIYLFLKRTNVFCDATDILEE